MSLNRREFVRNSLGAAAGIVLTAKFTPVFSKGSDFRPAVTIVKGGTPAENTRKAIEALGGIEKFVKPGQKVFIKPNCISTSRPETAINTNPEVVGEVVRLCKKAGAAEVLYLSHDDPMTLDGGSGVMQAILANGGKGGVATRLEQYITVKLPRGLVMKETMVIKELMEYDVFINIPVAKHHAEAQLTLSMKNYMGLNWDRITMHRTNLHQTIADLATVRPADLIVMDATRALLTNGPGGPGQVGEFNTIIATVDPVAADACAAELFKLEPANIRHIAAAYDMGLGEMNRDKMDMKEISLG